MKVIHMIEDYRKLSSKSRNSAETNVFELYKNYTKKYAPLFNSVFNQLYHAPIEALQKYIDETNFEDLLHKAEENYNNGICDYIISVAKESAKKMNVNFEFELMLGLELGNIGGCSLPLENNVSYVYIGIDRHVTEEIVDILIPHEMYHMIRIKSAPPANPETLLSRAIEEGLASYAPMWIYNMEWSIDNIAEILGVKPQQAAFLMENTEQIIKTIFQEGKEILSPEIMKKYFSIVDPNAELILPGYYFGLYLTHKSIQAGTDFNHFASLPAGEIINLWQEVLQNQPSPPLFGGK